MSVETWKELKNQGSQHYKKSQDEVEPIDLYRAGGMFRDFALSSIIKYAYRNRSEMGQALNPKDLGKIIHYAKLLMATVEDSTNGASTGQIVPRYHTQRRRPRKIAQRTEKND